MAKKFKLQSVLRYREILEDQARQRLTAALEQERALRARIACAKEELESLGEEFESKRCVGISVQDLLLYERELCSREEGLKELNTELSAQEQEVAARREALCRAGQERILLEKLKEKKELEEKEEQHRLETAMLDEVALQFRKEDV